ncbi:GNAT family N-acetyltransferase [Salinispirillum sp. LH 10-3-1]|uniref:GNAT family N-acetyltransferase n=1 Tax=Salinispirillum sp. LH 10-3-1 TaxID=2952525 RepID=A0AB38YJP4_9GAMM
MNWSLNAAQTNSTDLPQPSSSNPFLTEVFLSVLAESGSVTVDTGWEPTHARHTDGLFMPVYRKDHSYGEYVFDWSWANAYAHSGLNYYPKLLTAIPYTPSQGPRILGDWRPEHLAEWTAQLPDLCRDTGSSGWHILFPEPELAQQFKSPDYILRQDCQFHWQNKGYRDFHDFLDNMTARRRKTVRKERQKVLAQGVELRMIEGVDMTSDWLRQFYLFYHTTYLKRGRTGYLTESFFTLLQSRMAQQTVYALAFRGEELIGGALFFKSDERLFGRYWGALYDVDCLHFEACYYQGIEYAIAHGLRVFDPGTQGEHKIPRGFEPTPTFSAHWLAHREYHAAIAHHMRHERAQVEAYIAEARTLLPFKSDIYGEQP